MNKKPFRAADGTMIMLLAFALMLAAQLIAGFVLVAASIISETAIEIVQYGGTLLFEAVYLLVYIVYTKKKNIVSTFSPRNKITVWSILAAILIAFICFVSFIGLAYYFEDLLIKSGYATSDMPINSPISIVILVIATVIAAPICEETIFRSAFLSGATKVRKDEIGTAVLCGLCFALMHINPEQTIYQFCLGTVAAYITLKCRSVVPAIIVHAMSNGLALLMSFTSVGISVDGFYSQIGSNVLITLLLCLLLPVVACVLIWLICKFLKKAEQKKYPDKYNFPPKVIWIDEVTHEPIYEGGEVPNINDENRIVQRGFSPFTGAPVLVDRLELQNALMEEYNSENGEKSGTLGKNTYKTAFWLYMGLTIVFWLITLASGFFVNILV